MEKRLIKYLRKSDRKPYGVIVATGKDKIGIAICHKGDVWDRKLGLKIASGRAENGSSASSIKVPKEFSLTLKEAVESMERRAELYFK